MAPCRSIASPDCSICKNRVVPSAQSRSIVINASELNSPLISSRLVSISSHCPDVRISPSSSNPYTMIDRVNRRGRYSLPGVQAEPTRARSPSIHGTVRLLDFLAGMPR